MEEWAGIRFGWEVWGWFDVWCRLELDKFSFRFEGVIELWYFKQSLKYIIFSSSIIWIIGCSTMQTMKDLGGDMFM